MNRRIAFPFLTLSDVAVTADPWSLSLNGEQWRTAGEFLQDWDYASEIRIRRTLRIDPESAAQDLDITAGDLRLALGVRVGTGSGRLPSLIVLREHRRLEPGSWREELEIPVAGDLLSLVLDVRTHVMLAAPPGDSGSLSPRLMANRLWSDTLRVRLEGEEPRFPMEIADFRTLLGDVPGAAAPWFLHWSARDWHRDFHGATRLYLNRDQPEFIKRIEEQDGPTLQVLLGDVMGQICERLVSDPEADEIMSGAEPGTLGAQARVWLGRIWPGKDLDFIRSVLEQRPGRFRAVFLELAELGEA